LAGDDGGASEMEHGFIVIGFLFPANEETAKAIEPGVGAFDDPASGFGSGMTPLGFDFLAPSAQVQGHPGTAELDQALGILGCPVIRKPFMIETILSVCRPYLETAPNS
jgi:hypothetical protein